jgi:glycosyltransferase involved in cell wall biosynthesis
MKKNSSLVGIVIIGRNEGERLVKCLQSLPKICPVVYVDSASTDASVENATKCGALCLELDMSIPFTAARARNEGFQYIMRNSPELTYIHFIDADCELAEGWLEAAYEFLESNKGYISVCGRLREKNLNSSIYTRQCDMSWYIPPGDIDSCGGIATVRASIFQQLKGFNNCLIAGEEAEFYERARSVGYKVSCIDVFMGFHDSAIVSLKQWWVRNIRTGFVYADNIGKVNYNSQRRGVLIWGAIMPFAIAVISFINLLGISLSLIYPAQIIRITLKLDIPYKFSDKLLEGFFCVFAKFPQLLGLVKYKLNVLLKSDVKIIEYKK